MSYTFIQDTGTTAGSGLTTTAPSITVGANHALLIVGQGSSGGTGATPPTISDNNGNTANYVYAGQCIDTFADNLYFWYLLNANAGATAVKLVSSVGTIQNMYVVEYSGLGSYINISTNFINGASTGANALTSNSITIAATAMLWGFGYNASGIAMSAGTSPTSFTPRGASGYTVDFSSEDAPVSASAAATFGVTNGSSQFFVGAMAFTLASPSLAASPLSFGFTLEPATLGYGATYSLAASPLSFAYTLESATLSTTANTLAASPIAFSLTLQPGTLIYGAANFELLAAPLTFFVDMEPYYNAFSITGDTIAFAYSVEIAALLAAGNVPPRTMPNLVGLLLQEALQELEEAGILVPSSIGYFGTYPITVVWTLPVSVSGGFVFGSGAFGVASFGTTLQLPLGPGIVNAQSIAAGTGYVPPNTPIKLGVNQFPFGSVFPGGGGSIA